MTKIAVLVGSLREDSLNKKFAYAVAQVAEKDVEFIHADLNLPLYNTDLEANDFPKKAQELKDLIESSDGVLIVTPEYNRGYSSVIKNAIDWASRPWGSNSFDGKPVVLSGVSGSALGTTQAQAQLRNVMLYLNTKLMGQPEAYINGGSFFVDPADVAPESKDFLKHFVDSAVAHISNNK